MHSNDLATFGRAIAGLRALTRLHLRLAVDSKNTVSDAAWHLPKLTHLKIQGVSSDWAVGKEEVPEVLVVPVIQAANLQVLEVRDIGHVHGMTGRIFDIACSSGQLRALTLDDSFSQSNTRNFLYARDGLYERELRLWPMLTEINLAMRGLEAPGLLAKLADSAPALRRCAVNLNVLCNDELGDALSRLCHLEHAKILACRSRRRPATRTPEPLPALAMANRLLFLRMNARKSTLDGISLPSLCTLCLDDTDLCTVHSAVASCPALHTLVIRGLIDSDFKACEEPTVEELFIINSEDWYEDATEKEIRMVATAEVKLLSVLPSVTSAVIVPARANSDWFEELAQCAQRDPPGQLRGLWIDAGAVWTDAVLDRFYNRAFKSAIERLLRAQPRLGLCIRSCVERSQFQFLEYFANQFRSWTEAPVMPDEMWFEMSSCRDNPFSALDDSPEQGFMLEPGPPHKAETKTDNCLCRSSSALRCGHCKHKLSTDVCACGECLCQYANASFHCPLCNRSLVLP